MVVQHNLTAMNSNRMLGVTTKNQAKSTEKLSSGYKINRAADDAAGLSISEKMRKQIRGLTQASANAQDGISSVQTAEGALTEVHDMLQRMNELAVKAANGTNSKDDREYIQNEVDQLISEIDRVAETTKFNETYLLKGDDTKTATTIDAAVRKGGVDATYDSETKELKIKQPADGDKVTLGGKTYTIDTSAGDAANLAAAKAQTSINLKDYNDIAIDVVKAANTTALTGASADMTAAAGGTAGTYTLTPGTFSISPALELSLHVGADSAATNKITLSIDSLSAAGLKIKGVDVSGEDSIKATDAIDIIAESIQKVSKQRSALGAIQNRLEHTINNLDNVVENTTSAEAAIRDTDMATEMVRYSNNNILAQAGQSMLAQANQTNQGVLSLLQQ